MKKIIVGGVPEHFNLPWHLCIEDGSFLKAGLDVSWQDFPDGTGAMCKALREQKIDAAVILTEGVIKDILAGNPAKIVQEYIASPLIWGIHVDANSHYKNKEELRKAKVAISRFGSGSHLMAFVNAKNMGWNPEELEFEVVGDIHGAVKALRAGTAGYFLWEHFTTKPLVDNGTFRRLGNCPTPWSCFVIAVRENFLRENPTAVQNMLKILNGVTRKFKDIPAIETILAKKYDQKQVDIEQWLDLTTWSQKQISVMEIERVQQQLKELDLIDEIADNSRFIAEF